MRVPALLAVLFLALLARPTPAAADDPEAQALYTEAGAAFEAGELARAEELLRQALSIVEEARYAFNLALVLTELDRPAEALRFVEALLDDRYGALPDDRTLEAVELRRTLEDMVGTIVLDASRGVTVTVDDLAPIVVAAGTSESVSVDPGEHRIAVDGDDDVITSRVSAGERVVVEVAPPESSAMVAAVGGAGDADDDEANVIADEESGSVFASPWFWLAAALVVGAGVAVTVVVLTQRQSTLEDPVLGSAEALRGAPLVSW